MTDTPTSPPVPSGDVGLIEVTKADIDVAERALVIWGRAVGGPATEAIAAAISRTEATRELQAERDKMREAILTVVGAIRDYLPPDGIDAQECLNRIIGATDNPEINPIIKELEHGRS